MPVAGLTDAELARSSDLSRIFSPVPPSALTGARPPRAPKARPQINSLRGGPFVAKPYLGIREIGA